MATLSADKRDPLTIGGQLTPRGRGEALAQQLNAIPDKTTKPAATPWATITA